MGQNVVIRKEACPACREKGYDEKDIPNLKKGKKGKDAAAGTDKT